MSGIDFIADTNALLYLLNGNACMQSYSSKKLGISIISEMELLSFSDINQEDEKIIRALIKDCLIFELNHQIKNKTILLRKKYRIKLPDAIIAATAIENNIKLLTADKGFNKITELDLVILEPTN
ncbi:MAG: type II toxin-antitoxin system VapC family toxin [Neisseriaceae bacterium]|nr:type II toxin-antitoxin system VapC family toxin [Neisseriaceae bacterium]MBR5674858.1 type II toxin-antitoxin system VapC family toxin [Neisseriaceae bacterium]